MRDYHAIVVSANVLFLQRQRRPTDRVVFSSVQHVYLASAACAERAPPQQIWPAFGDASNLLKTGMSSPCS